MKKKILIERDNGGMPRRRKTRFVEDDLAAVEALNRMMELRALHEACAIRLQRAFRKCAIYNGGFVLL
jgi:hypothetical protein